MVLIKSVPHNPTMTATALHDAARREIGNKSLLKTRVPSMSGRVTDLTGARQNARHHVAKHVAAENDTTRQSRGGDGPAEFIDQYERKVGGQDHVLG